MLPENYKNEKGQALLIVLLAMAVILTIVLSISSRSITEIKMSEYEESSARALSAAEAGIEEVLIAGSDLSGTLPNNATYTTTVKLITPSGNAFVYPEGIEAGESVAFWFVSHNPDGDLICTGEACFQGDKMRFCWGSSGVPESALELIFFYDSDANRPWEPPDKDFSNVKVKRLAYDPLSATRTPSNNFSATDTSTTCTLSGAVFAYQTPEIDLSNTFNGICDPSITAGCLLMVKARLFYNEDNKQLIGISTPNSVGPLPPQGAQIDSTGSFSDATRRVNVYRSYPSPPDVFDSAIFSYSNIVK